jgi:hypothetical protein
MNVITPTAKLSAAEVERRRKIVRQADANNRIEGVVRTPDTDSIVASFVRGDIEATDMMRLLKALPDPR